MISLKKIHTIVFQIGFIGAISIMACSKEEVSGDTSAPVAEGVRLKHLTNDAAVTAAIGDYTSGYQIRKGTSSYTNIGNYPMLPHVYYYGMGWEKKLGDDAFAIRFVKGSAGHGKDTKEQILTEMYDYQEINNGSLGKAPYTNVFAIRYKENAKKRVEL